MATDKTLKKALEQFKLSAQTYKDQREREVDYLKFQIGELQWPSEIRAYRESQFGNQGVPMPPDPTMSISMIDEPIQLILNQERASNLEPHIHALSEDASDQTAVVLEELNRHIDVDPESKASTARTWAYARGVKAGTGWYYIDKVFDREGGHPFDQKLLVKRVLYQDGIFPDPTAQQADWSDGMFLHDVVDLLWESYRANWPKSKLARYSNTDFVTMGNAQPNWVFHAELPEKRAVRVSNYWRVEITERRYVLLDDQSVVFDDEIPDGRRIATDEDIDAWGYEGPRERIEEVRKVFKSVINGVEILEPETEWDGQYIPYIPDIGIELIPFDGERRWVGMIAGAMDSQRLVNYSASQAVKMAALEPQAPWQGEEGVFENHEQEYAQTNTRKFPFLQYKPTNSSGQRSTAPARVQVDVSRLGPSMQLLQMGKDFVQRAMFTFGPGLGEQTPAHRSGTAIEALQSKTMQGTSHFLDNLANISLPLEMKIKLDLIPKVYDRPGRVVQVITGEGKTRSVMLNQPFQMHPQTKRPIALPASIDGQAQPQEALHYDLKKGRYGITVTIGKSSDSRLQEGGDALGRLMEADPQLLPILGPSWAGFQDFPGAIAVKNALVKWQAHVAPWMVDQPEANLAQQLQQTQAQLQALTEAAKKMKQDLDSDALKYKTQLAIKDLDHQTAIALQRMKDSTAIEVARINAAKEAMIAEREAAEESIALGQKLTADAFQADKDRAHEVAAHTLEHAAALTQQHQVHEQAIAQSAQENQHALEQADAQRLAAEAAQPATEPAPTAGA